MSQSLQFASICAHYLFTNVSIITVGFYVCALFIYQCLYHYSSLLFVRTIYLPMSLSLQFAFICAHYLFTNVYIITVRFYLCALFIYQCLYHYSSLFFVGTIYLPMSLSLQMLLFVRTIYLPMSLSLQFAFICGHYLFTNVSITTVRFYLCTLFIYQCLYHYSSLLCVRTIYLPMSLSLQFASICAHYLFTNVFITTVRFYLCALFIYQCLYHYSSLLFVRIIYLPMSRSLQFVSICAHYLFTNTRLMTLLDYMILFEVITS